MTGFIFSKRFLFQNLDAITFDYSIYSYHVIQIRSDKRMNYILLIPELMH